MTEIRFPGWQTQRYNATMTDTTSARIPQPLRRLAGRMLEKALNHALALDPDTRHALAALENCRVLLHLRGPELTLTLRVAGERLWVEPTDKKANPATRTLQVSATPGRVLTLVWQHDDDRVPPGHLAITGDADLARHLQQLIERFSPDIEEAFARTFGDVLGVPLARACGRAQRHVKASIRHLATDSVAWLRDETRMVVAAQELEAFLDEVDALSEASQRLEARVQRLNCVTEKNTP